VSYIVYINEVCTKLHILLSCYFIKIIHTIHNLDLKFKLYVIFFLLKFYLDFLIKIFIIENIKRLNKIFFFNKLKSGYAL